MANKYTVFNAHTREKVCENATIEQAMKAMQLKQASSFYKAARKRGKWRIYTTVCTGLNKPVNEFSADTGKLTARYDSVAQAAKLTYYSKSTISRYCAEGKAAPNGKIYKFA